MSPGTCIHFRGTQTKICGAGVNLRQHVGGPDLGWGCRIPCIKRQFNEDRPAEKVPCEKYTEPTSQQIEESKKEFQRYSLNATTAAAAIIGHSAGKRGVRGVLDCPICKSGKLHYEVSGYNGHKRAQCTTKDCVNFIE